MSLQLGNLRDALIDAGADQVKADRAAAEVASYEGRLGGIDLRMERLEGRVSLLVWMVGFNLVVTVGVLWRVMAH